MNEPTQLLLLAIPLLAMGSILIGVLRTGISPMPSSHRAQQTILSYVRPTLDGAIIELGAGWGGLAVPLARAHPERQVLAYEVSTIPWLFLRTRAALGGTPNLIVHRADFFNADLSIASAIVCYLYPEGMKRLGEKLNNELLPNTVVVSNTFAIPGWSATKTTKLNDMHGTRIYLYHTA